MIKYRTRLLELQKEALEQLMVWRALSEPKDGTLVILAKNSKDGDVYFNICVDTKKGYYEIIHIGNLDKSDLLDMFINGEIQL